MYGRSWVGVYVAMCVPYSLLIRVRVMTKAIIAHDVYTHVAATAYSILFTLSCVCVCDGRRLLGVYVMCVYPNKTG